MTEPPPEVDFTDEPDVAVGPAPLPDNVPYSIGVAREQTRGRLGRVVLALVGLYALLITAAAVALVRPFDDRLVSALLAGVFTPLMTVVGTVVGFYFGTGNEAKQQ